MRTRRVLFHVIAAAAGFGTICQAAISVGPSGTGTITFDTAPYAPPAATEWSTVGRGSGSAAFTNACDLDVNSNTNAASNITGTLGTQTVQPPNRLATAQWNTNGFLQTRSTSVAYTLLMATLQNNSGGTISSLNVSYTFDALAAGTIEEEIPGHRAYFSLTGAANTWQIIPEFCTGAPGNLSANLDLGSWANGSTLYILWADDNAAAEDSAPAYEGGYTIDNFTATDSAVVGPQYCWVNFAGQPGSPGDVDGPTGTSRLNGVYGAACDNVGNVYIADFGNSKVKKITPGGVVTTLPVAGLSTPTAVVVNQLNGNLYVADYGNSAIKKITPPYTNATTIDSGYQAIGLGVDSTTDTVYVGNLGNNTIKKITGGGTVTTLAGNGSSGSVNGTLLGSSFSAPCGIAADASGNLYVADRNNSLIRKINIAGNAVTTVAGSGDGCADGAGVAAKFKQPTGITIGPDANFYVADQDNLTIRKVTPAGVVTTLGGDCTLGYGSADGCGSSAQFSNIGHVAVDGAGNLYVADRSNSRVSKGTLSVAVAATLAITSISIPPGPQQYGWTNFAGSLTVPGDMDGPTGMSLLNGTYGASCDSAGNVYIADRGNGKIKKITPEGVCTTVLGGFSGLTELVVNKVTGNLYIVDACCPELGSGAIKKITLPDLVVTTIDDGYNAIGLGVDETTDTVYVGNMESDTIRQIPSGGLVTVIAGDGMAGLVNGPLLSARFNNPCGIAVDGAGNLYVADRENHAVRYIDFGSGTVSTVAGNGSMGCPDGTGSAARFFALTGVTLGPDGNIYVADQDNHTVRKLTPAGVVTTLGGLCGIEAGAADGIGGDARNGFLGQVAVDSALNIYTADRNGRVARGVLLPPGPGNVQIDFTAAANNTVCSFKLQSSATVNGTYADVAATISQLGPNAYRAVIVPSGDTQFYRVKEN